MGVSQNREAIGFPAQAALRYIAGMVFGLYRKRTPPLGDLERQMLELLWTHGASSAQQLHAQLVDEHPIRLSTVQSTLERLVRKELLAREKRGRAYCYTPALSRQTLLARMVAELVSDLGNPSDSAALGLIELSEDVDETTLAQLEAWVAATRRARGDGDNT